jgi:hypothetical protein
MFAVAHRPQMQDAASQSLLLAIQATGEQVPPQPHAALAATVETWIAIARVFGCALEASHQAGVGTFERASDAAIPHS